MDKFNTNNITCTEEISREFSAKGTAIQMLQQKLEIDTLSYEFNKKLEFLVRNKLQEKGFVFKDRDQFLEFIKERMTKQCFKNNPNKSILYLDNKTPLIEWEDKFDYNSKERKATYTILMKPI